MANNSSLYGDDTNSLGASPSNYTTLYSGGTTPVPGGDNVVITGTLTVNGCSIFTDCSAFNLFPQNANTLNIGLESTTLALGATTGVTTVRNQLATADYSFPTADGTANQVLITNGAGVLSFADVQSLDTNYNIQADTATGGANLTLVGSDSTTDSVKFANGAGVSIVRTDANTITITNTGVTSITGTANQVITSSSTGAVTLSLPQDIATTSSPTFQNMLLNGSLTVNLDGTGSDGVIYVNSSTGSPQSTLRWNGAQWIFDDNVYITQTSATTNARISPLALTATSSGTAAVGIATSLDYVTESTYSGNLNSGYISVRMDDNTAGSEDFSMRFGLKQNGTTYSTKAILDSGGNLILDGGITVSGSTSGSSTFNAPATGSTLTYTLPGAAGAASTVLTNDGSGNLSWALPGGGGSTFGNITVAVVDDNTISTTTGNLFLTSATGVVEITNSLNVDSGTLFVDPTNNRVGINTMAPIQELTVNAAGDGYCQIGMENAERTWLVTNNDGDNLISYSVVIPSPFSVTNRFQFDATGGDQWFNSGKLGVNNNAPAYELDVSGTGRFTNDLIVGTEIQINGATSGSTSLIQVDGSADVNYYLPTAQGSASTVLTNDGSGNLSWAATGNPFDQSLNTTDNVLFNIVGATTEVDSPLIYTDEIRSYSISDVTIKNGIADVWTFRADGYTQFPSYTFPYFDGTASQVLLTDGAGNISFADRNPFDQSLNITDNVEFASVKTPTIYTQTIRPFDNTTNQIGIDTTGTGTYQTGKAGLFVEQSASIPNGIAGFNINSNLWYFLNDGRTQFPNYIFPAADGAPNEVLTTNGLGQISWALPGGGGSTFGNITVGVVTDNTISTTTGDLVLASATNIIDATTATFNAGAYTIDSRGTIDSSSTTTTSTSTVTLNNTTRNGLKCLISVVDNVTSARHIVEALLLEQGTTAYITTYAEMYSSAALATFSAVISAGNLTLQATPASANSTTFTVIRTSID